MYSVTAITHPALGSALRLTGLSPSPLTLSLTEAHTIARALLAVRQGRSAETDIYLSPIASDADFQAHVNAEGVCCHGQQIGWAEVEKLATTLLGTA